MPVSVSLELLVSIAGTRPAWPEKFVGLIATLEEMPDEGGAWLVLADWLQEHDEREMEETCRWVERHNEVYAEKDYMGCWRFKGLPPGVEAQREELGHLGTLAGAIAMLTARLRKARKELA